MLDRRQATIVGRPLYIVVLSLSFQDFLAENGSEITPTLKLLALMFDLNDERADELDRTRALDITD